MQTPHSEKPFVIIMVGIPGSGKSQFAEQFGKTMNAPVVSLAHVAQYATDATSAANIVKVMTDDNRP